MLTRKQIVLRAKNNGMIDYNYNYELMKLIYKSMEELDEEKAKFLHDEGFKIDGKTYKLFTQTLIFEKNSFVKEGISVNKGDNIRLLVGGKKDIVKSIVMSLLNKDVVSLLGVDFEVVEVLNDTSNVKFKKQMLYKTITPVVESIYEDGIKYLSPFDNEFFNAMAQNLLKKYELIYGEKYEGDLFFDIEDTMQVKEKKIHCIKGRGFAKGYGKFNIWIEANPDMQKVAYYCGLGQKNSLGAGVITYITGRW